MDSVVLETNYICHAFVKIKIKGWKPNLEKASTDRRRFHDDEDKQHFECCYEMNLKGKFEAATLEFV